MLNTTVRDASERRPKVQVIADVIDSLGLGTEVVPMQKDLVRGTFSKPLVSVMQCLAVWMVMRGAIC